ncbi:MAG: hypothetical protein IT318_19280, partial [Anaerolineales bacterium]|nr:hypothetical protein [Anaerolineales bacterium]
GRLGRLALPAWLVLFAPGLLLLSLAPRAAPAGSGRAARWGAALALSLALLALGWLWVGVFGLHWSLAALRVAYGLLGLVWALHWVLVVCLRRRDTKPRDANEAVSSTQPPAHILSLLILLVAGLLARLVAARDLALPQWVDGPHHFAIARLLAETGQVPPSYEPVLPIAPFLYHFGFHALAVTVHWLSGLPLEEVLLDLGQLLQGLVPLAAYAGVAALTGRPRAGLLAAAFLALVSYFPGYYLTWGRYTHLTGVLLLFPALALVWRLALPAPRAARRQDGMVGSIGLAGILAAGLLVTHYVVFVLWLAWAALAGAAALARRLVGGRLGRRSAPSPGTDANHAGAAGEPAASLLLAGLTGALLAAPWLWRLAGTLAGLAAQPQRLAAPLGYNAFPFEYFSSPLECGWLTLAGGCLVWGLLRRDRLVAFVAAWLGALAALVNLGPGNWLVNNNALAISLFVPGAIVLGWGADRWLGVALAWVAPFPTQATARPTLTSPENLRIAITSGDGRDTGNSEATEAMRTDHAPGDAAPASAEPGSSLALRLRLLAGALMLALLAGLLAYGAARGLPAQVSVVNRVTVLATPADRAALEWLEANTPAGAVFAINSWEWLNGTWAGSDAGGWIWPLTGRRTTLPPADYAYGSAGWQAEVNAWQQRLAEATAEGAAPAPQLLRAADVTHIFIGARGGPLRPEMFVDQPGYALVYTNGSAWIFAVVE